MIITYETNSDGIDDMTTTTTIQSLGSVNALLSLCHTHINSYFSSGTPI